jgi:hypothetical protein
MAHDGRMNGLGRVKITSEKLRKKMEEENEDSLSRK